mgnify:CR=1 FL=1
MQALNINFGLRWNFCLDSEHSNSVLFNHYHWYNSNYHCTFGSSECDLRCVLSSPVLRFHISTNQAIRFVLYATGTLKEQLRTWLNNRTFSLVSSKYLLPLDYGIWSVSGIIQQLILPEFQCMVSSLPEKC